MFSGGSLDLSPPTGPAQTTGVVLPALKPQRSPFEPQRNGAKASHTKKVLMR